MILANITILPLWATCVPWNAIVPMPICAAFRFPPSLTARCSRASCRGSAERAGAGRQRKPTGALCGRRENVCDAELSEAYFFSELQKCGTPQQAAFALLRLHGYSIAEIAARYNLDPRRALAGCSKVCIPPICGSVGTERRRQNEGSAHKDAPRASAPTIKDRQQRAHRPRKGSSF